MFASTTLELEDLRKDDGEMCVICYGLLDGRLVVVGYTRVARIVTVSALTRRGHQQVARHEARLANSNG